MARRCCQISEGHEDQSGSPWPVPFTLPSRSVSWAVWASTDGMGVGSPYVPGGALAAPQAATGCPAAPHTHWSPARARTAIAPAFGAAVHPVEDSRVPSAGPAPWPGADTDTGLVHLMWCLPRCPTPADIAHPSGKRPPRASFPTHGGEIGAAVCGRMRLAGYERCGEGGQAGLRCRVGPTTRHRRAASARPPG